MDFVFQTLHFNSSEHLEIFSQKNSQSGRAGSKIIRRRKKQQEKGNDNKADAALGDIVEV